MQGGAGWLVSKKAMQLWMPAIDTACNMQHAPGSVPKLLRSFLGFSDAFLWRVSHACRVLAACIPHECRVYAACRFRTMPCAASVRRERGSRGASCSKPNTTTQRGAPAYQHGCAAGVPSYTRSRAEHAACATKQHTADHAARPSQPNRVKLARATRPQGPVDARADEATEARAARRQTHVACRALA